jgi:hypothetical protein
MAEPSIALVPSTIGEKVYSVLPDTGDGDFNFTRNGTATRVNPEGYIEEVPIRRNRLNYPIVDGEVKGCAHLLLEPSTTNGFPNSIDFGTNWGSNRLDRTDNAIISPDGTANGTKVAQQSGFTTAANINYAGITAGTKTISIFVKAGTFEYLAFSLNGVSYFNIKDGYIDQLNSQHTATIENYGNGWYRCSITTTTTSTLTAAYYFAERNNTLTTSDTQGYMYIWGAQIEGTAYLTSFIKTEGSAVTRNNETCLASGSTDTFNSVKGVVYLHIEPIAQDSTNRRIVISDGTSTNRIIMGMSTSNGILATIYNGANQFVGGGNYVGREKTHKVALLYQANNFKVYFNGQLVASATSGSVFSADTLSEFDLADSNNALNFYGKVKGAEVYKDLLTDSELEKLTSWDSFAEMAEDIGYTIA